MPERTLPMTFCRALFLASLSLGLAAPAVAQQPNNAANSQQQKSGADPKAQGNASDSGRFENRAENVVRQPARDIGLMRENPPEVLKDAQKAPYTLVGLRRCRDFTGAVAGLDAVLGPDVDAVNEQGDALPTRLAEAGAKTVVNALIPFRGLVREATGAAEADRKFRMMVTAGVARRAFLKGIARERKCRF